MTHVVCEAVEIVAHQISLVSDRQWRILIFTCVNGDAGT